MAATERDGVFGTHSPTRWAAAAGRSAVSAWLTFAGAAPADEADVLFRGFSGTPDVAAADGEAAFRDQEGIYCWWECPEIRPGYVEVIARARTTDGEGAMRFTLTDAGDGASVESSVSRVQRGVVTSGAYEEIYCGTFYWDGSYTPRLSDWSSPGLMLDWVKLRQVAAGDVRDPLPGVLKQYDAPRFASPPEIDGDLSEWVRVPWIHLGEESARSAAYGGTPDLSAAVGFAWSPTHLYVACDVTDDSFTTLDDRRALSTLWQYDGIQLAIDAAGDAGGPGYDDNDYEYGFAQTAGGPTAYRWVAGNSLPVGDVPTIEVAGVRFLRLVGGMGGLGQAGRRGPEPSAGQHHFAAGIVPGWPRTAQRPGHGRASLGVRARRPGRHLLQPDVGL